MDEHGYKIRKLKVSAMPRQVTEADPWFLIVEEDDDRYVGEAFTKNDAQLFSAAPELLDIARRALDLALATQKDMQRALMSAEDKQVWEVALGDFMFKILEAIAKADGMGKKNG